MHRLPWDDRDFSAAEELLDHCRRKYKPSTLDSRLSDLHVVARRWRRRDERVPTDPAEFIAAYAMMDDDGRDHVVEMAELAARNDHKGKRRSRRCSLNRLREDLDRLARKRHAAWQARRKAAAAQAAAADEPEAASAAE